jgi:hypothetical protein
LLIHKRLHAKKKGVAGLRKRLATTIRWGLKMKTDLLDQQKTDAHEKDRVKAELIKEARQSKVQLDRERRRQMVLSENLKNATAAADALGQNVVQMRQTLGTLQRDRFGLQKKLAAEANITLAFRTRVGQETANEENLRQKLTYSSQELSTHFTIEQHERQSEEADRQKIAAKSNALAQMQRQLRHARHDKAKEDVTLNTTRRELQAWSEHTKKQKEEARQQETQLRELLVKEQKAEERATLLSQELQVQTKLASTEKAHEMQMGQLVNALRDNVRTTVSNFTWRIGIAEAAKKELAQDNDRLREDLRSNFTRDSHLQTEVLLLEKRVGDGEKARLRAEKAMRKTEEQKVAAQSISKQLSGTVPRLLEQTQMAKEARDAEEAMRAQAKAAQAAAQKEVAGLEMQYTSAVQTQLEQLNKVLPDLDAQSQSIPQGGQPPPSASLASSAVPEDDMALPDEAPVSGIEDLADAETTAG